jgi:hypothetical protein
MLISHQVLPRQCPNLSGSAGRVIQTFGHRDFQLVLATRSLREKRVCCSKLALPRMTYRNPRSKHKAQANPSQQFFLLLPAFLINPPYLQTTGTEQSTTSPDRPKPRPRREKLTNAPVTICRPIYLDILPASKVRCGF